MTVKTPPRNAEGSPAWTEVLFRMAVERTADAASDAFESRLPVRDDRERVTKRALEELRPGVPFKLPEVTEGARPGTLRRQVLLSQQPALVKMAAGLDFFRSYPYGCTEQQMSRARAYLAFRKFRAPPGPEGRREGRGPRGQGHPGLPAHRRRPERPRGLLAGLAGLRVPHRLDRPVPGRGQGRRLPGRREAALSPAAHAGAGAALRLQPLHRRRELRRARVGPRRAAPGRPGQPRLRGGARAQDAVPRPRGRGGRADRLRHHRRLGAPWSLPCPRP